jgi:hypothetical protein
MPIMLVPSAGPGARRRPHGRRRRPSRAAFGAVLQRGRWPAVNQPPMWRQRETGPTLIEKGGQKASWWHPHPQKSGRPGFRSHDGGEMWVREMIMLLGKVGNKGMLMEGGAHGQRRRPLPHHGLHTLCALVFWEFVVFSTMSCPFRWNQANIRHMRGALYGKKCCIFKFSFSSHENPFFIFQAPIHCFCETATRNTICNGKEPTHQNRRPLLQHGSHTSEFLISRF